MIITSISLSFEGALAPNHPLRVREIVIHSCYIHLQFLFYFQAVMLKGVPPWYRDYCVCLYLVVSQVCKCWPPGLPCCEVWPAERNFSLLAGIRVVGISSRWLELSDGNKFLSLYYIWCAGETGQATCLHLVLTPLGCLSDGENMVGYLLMRSDLNDGSISSHLPH